MTAVSQDPANISDPASLPDPASLANLADIVLTAPPSFWPPAPGVWIVAAALAAMLVVALWRGLRRYRANGFLRDADAKLADLARTLSNQPETADQSEFAQTRKSRSVLRSNLISKRSSQTSSQNLTANTTLNEVMSDILKRAALVVYGRRRVAALTGAEWRDFLAQTTPAGASPPLRMPAGETEAQIAAARAWLRARRHRPENTGKGE